MLHLIEWQRGGETSTGESGSFRWFSLARPRAESSVAAAQEGTPKAGSPVAAAQEGTPQGRVTCGRCQEETPPSLCEGET